MTYNRVTWLLPVLRDAGLKVATVSGWEGRGRPASTGNLDPIAVLNHHTGTKTRGNHPTLGMVTRGRADLPGPLCHILLARNGVPVLVAAGRANHAGLTNGAGILAKGDGNSQLVGIEVETSGYEQMTTQQRAVLPILNAAILRHLGRGLEGAFLHETTSVTGKWDLAEDGETVDLADLRVETGVALARLQPKPASRTDTRLPVVDLSRAVHAFRKEGHRPRTAAGVPLYPDGVRLIETELANAGFLDRRLVDGYAGPPTLRAYQQWQRRLGYRQSDADGIPGATSLVKLGVRGKDSFKVRA